MYYITLDKFWWKWAKKKGYLKNNGKHGVKFVKSKKLGMWWVIRETIKEKMQKLAQKLCNWVERKSFRMY